jgi:ankyrin repeat protein
MYFGIHYEFPLDNTDSVLQCISLQYSKKSGESCTAGQLLESNIDRCSVDMIRQRAQDPDYIGPIIIGDVIVGYLLLLEFISSIGVNNHQANSRRYPSPLHAAIGNKKLQVISWLIKHGADCNTKYSDSQTHLFHAVTEGSVDVFRVLVSSVFNSVHRGTFFGKGACLRAKLCTYSCIPRKMVGCERRLKSKDGIVDREGSRECVGTLQN